MVELSKANATDGVAANYWLIWIYWFRWRVNVAAEKTLGRRWRRPVDFGARASFSQAFR